MICLKAHLEKILKLKTYLILQALNKQTLIIQKKIKKSGILRPENGDNIIDEFSGEKSKVYGFTYDDKEYHKKLDPGELAKLIRCKGTVKATVRDNITIDTIKDTVMNSTLTKHDNYCIRSKMHKLGIYKINKVSLSCYDDKRFILEDGITSYAHGHKAIKNYISTL